LNEQRVTPKTVSDHAGNLYVESANLRGITRISFNEWSATFGISAPLEWLCLTRRVAARRSEQSR
jgi:hypothetical protein